MTNAHHSIVTSCQLCLNAAATVSPFCNRNWSELLSRGTGIVLQLKAYTLISEDQVQMLHQTHHILQHVHVSHGEAEVCGTVQQIMSRAPNCEAQACVFTGCAKQSTKCRKCILATQMPCCSHRHAVQAFASARSTTGTDVQGNGHLLLSLNTARHQHDSMFHSARLQISTAQDVTLAVVQLSTQCSTEGQ